MLLPISSFGFFLFSLILEAGAHSGRKTVTGFPFPGSTIPSFHHSQGRPLLYIQGGSK